MVITNYIRSAMRRATYEILPDGTYYGEIPGFQGVYANAPTLEECRETLQEVLEGLDSVGATTRTYASSSGRYFADD
jgi:hypothetical protein